MSKEPSGSSEETRIYLGRLFELTDRRGTRYLVGRLGEATLFIYPSTETRAAGDPVFHMWLKQRREADVPDDGEDPERRS